MMYLAHMTQTVKSQVIGQLASMMLLKIIQDIRAIDMKTSIITNVITPVIKHTIHGSLVLWEDTRHVSLRAGLYESFTMMSEDYAEYVPVRFESL